MPNTLIRNGTVVTASETKAADVLIEDSRIKEVRSGIPTESAEKIIDASGMYVIPGGIDAHTHLDMPFGGTTCSDDFETGTRAAAFGGTTSHRRFRHPGARNQNARCVRHLAEKSRRHALALTTDCT